MEHGKQKENSTMTEIHHHGDVVLIPISEDDLPNMDALKLVPRDSAGRAIIAEGEVTGHAHAITAPADDVSIYQLVDVEDMGERFLKIIREVTITHEEHGPMTLKPGVYRAKIAREWDPIEGARRVVD